MMSKLDLQVRGIHGGVLITLPAVPWYQQRDLIVGRIQTQERFFKGGRIALDVGLTDWSEEQLLKLMKDLADEGVCLWTILSDSERTRQAAEYHGFPTTLPNPNKKPGEIYQNQTDSQEALQNFACLPRSLAEGEKFMHAGNLLVLGDVPADAQVEVTGSLVLWGSLQGIASVNLADDPINDVRILKLEDGSLVLDGEEIEIPAKYRKHNGLMVSRDETGIVISSLLPRRLL